jgi:transcription initiation factor TFIIIB Brf1 subunit/transcription initiation factor TFIIB
MNNNTVQELFISQPSCNWCGSDDIRDDPYNGIMKCVKCGLVLDSIISTAQERFSESSGTRVNYGPVRSLAVSNNNKSSSKIVNKFHDESYDSSIVHAVKEIKYYASLMDLKSSVVSDAETQLHKLRNQMESFKGFSMEHIAVAILYVAINLNQLPYSWDRIAKMTGLHYEKISSVYYKIQQYCDHVDTSILSSFSQTKEAKQLALHCRNLGINKDTAAKAEEILQKIIKGMWLNGKPSTNLAVAIWAALCTESTSSGITVDQISQEVGTSAKTIKDSYKKISEYLIFKV